jgi:hypothetical protein
MPEVKSHTNLSTHSQPFVLTTGGAYQVNVNGLTIGGDPVELHMLDSHGQPVSLSDDVKFPATGSGAITKRFVVPPGTTMRWTVPRVPGVALHSMTSNITSAA